MKIAVEGCAHGELQKIYEALQEIEKREKMQIDLLLCCGDFQATRNLNDLETMAVPRKFHNMGSYYKYYTGELRAPYLTIIIGGNHEASNHMQELPYGGWVAPNIYYLGYAGVVRVKGVRIGGLSGIYKSHDYHMGRFEYSPYDNGTRRSVYHVRQLDVFRLKQLSGRIDVFLSHDWPRGIYEYGNKERLLRFKPHFRDEVERGVLGNRPAEELLKHLKPSFWFAAHMHCKFSALYPHDDASTVDANETTTSCQTTKFLALDKCLPRRNYLQVIDIEVPAEYKDAAVGIEYDPEWLTILNITNHLLGTSRVNYFMPGSQATNMERTNFTPTNEELNCIREKFHNNFVVPQNFCRTVPAYNPNEAARGDAREPPPQSNPQTVALCSLLDIDDPINVAMAQQGLKLAQPSIVEYIKTASPAEQAKSPLTTPNDPDVSECKRSRLIFNLPAPVNSSPVSDTATQVASKEELHLPDSSDEEEQQQQQQQQQQEQEQEVEVTENSAETTVDAPPAPTSLDNGNAVKWKLKRRNQNVVPEEQQPDEPSSL